jgi:polyisoprenoid-binding protein YceI
MAGERPAARRHHSLIPERSAVLLKVDTSLGPVSFGANGLDGFIEAAVDGERIDVDNAPAAHLELDVIRLTSGNSIYDTELRRQIDARRFPRAYVDLHRARAIDRDSSTFHVSGEITLRGVTVPADGVVVADLPDRARMVVSGEETLNISDFGIPPPSLFMIKIDPEVKLRLYLEAQGE